MTALLDDEQALATQLSGSALGEIDEMPDAAYSARTAAAAARDAAFGSAPILGIGDAAWRSLWDAAARFAAEVYPGAEYPANDAAQVCVLCQRPLDDDAHDRLHTFRN